jgi:hypothetical protein
MILRTRHFAAPFVAVLALAACSGGDGDEGVDDEVAVLDTDPVASDATDGTATTTGEDESFQDSVLAYTACLREQGIDIDDPQFDANGNPIIDRGSGDGGLLGLDTDDPEVAAAQEACADELEGAAGQFTADPEAASELQENLLAFAQCMRDRGIDFPDPQFDANGRPIPPEGGGDLFGLDRDDPGFQAAREKCQQEIGDVFGGGGPNGADD